MSRTWGGVAVVFILALAGCSAPGGLIVHDLSSNPNVGLACAQLASNGQLRSDGGVPAYVEVRVTAVNQLDDLSGYDISGVTTSHASTVAKYDWTCKTVVGEGATELTATMNSFEARK